MRSLNNLCVLTDSYKVSHWRQLPPSMQHMDSYFESRGGPFNDRVFFGLHYFLKEYLSEGINLDKIEYAQKRWTKHFNDPSIFNMDGWKRVLEKHNGKIPIEIRSLPEGTITTVSNVMMTVRNTDPEFPWLTNWFETLLSQIWYPCTVATLSREIKKIIKQYLEKTGDPSLLPFKYHDFGFRGVSCPEQAAIGGAAHLINFMGTDTAPAFELINEFYGEEMAGFSIPASEHSIMTNRGPDFEEDAVGRIIKEFGNSPCGLYAMVGDSYEIINFFRNILGKKFKHQIIQAKNVLVGRPDSGIPEQICVEISEEICKAFGYDINKKGYRVFHPKIRGIYGDGMRWITPTQPRVELVLSNLALKGLSADNWSYGSGGGLLQQMDRDTFSFAFKCCSSTHDGVEIDAWKKPSTDSGKNSKRGRLISVNDPTLGISTVRLGSSHLPDMLQTTFFNGDIKINPVFSGVKKNAEI